LNAGAAKCLTNKKRTPQALHSRLSALVANLLNKGSTCGMQTAVDDQTRGKVGFIIRHFMANNLSMQAQRPGSILKKLPVYTYSCYWQVVAKPISLLPVQPAMLYIDFSKIRYFLYTLPLMSWIALFIRKFSSSIHDASAVVIPFFNTCLIMSA
jgi:hypothetical protein